MTDTLTPLQRSWVMSRVPSRNTRPELLARSLLHRLGYRFTVNGPKNKQLPGRPDIVLPSRRAVVFVHGCFWHRHPGCPLASIPKSNAPYWTAKFERNVARDAQALAQLAALGWRPITLWECELKSDLPAALSRLLAALPRSQTAEPPEDHEDALLVAETQAPYRPKKH